MIELIFWLMGFIIVLIYGVLLLANKTEEWENKDVG